MTRAIGTRSVRLVPLNQKEFALYLEQDIRRYAQENITAGIWTEAEAVENSRAAHDRLLPQGMATANNYLYAIVDAANGKTVGNVWLMADRGSDRSTGFVYDLFVNAEHRRRGYATWAMLALEQEAVRLGLTSIALHVFAHNSAAFDLYQRLGYQVRGLHMAKSLALGKNADEA